MAKLTGLLLIDRGDSYIVFKLDSVCVIIWYRKV